MRWESVSALDSAKLKEFWDKLRHEGSFWDRFEGKDFKAFQAMLSTSAMLFELPYGYVRVEYDRKVGTVWIHAAFWSPRVFRHTEELTALGKYIGELIGVREICTIIPAMGKGLPHLVEKVGFQLKGTLLNFYPRTEICTDALLYGMMV